MFSPGGTVQLQPIPEETRTGSEILPAYDILRGILSQRVLNRGLEGIAVTHQGILYAVMRRPLANPAKALSEASRNIRIVEVDLAAVLGGRPGPVGAPSAI